YSQTQWLMISAGNRNPLYDGAPVPTSPAPLDPPRRRSADHPSRQATSQVDDAPKRSTAEIRPALTTAATAMNKILKTTQISPRQATSA
nr:hypothetical protein [Actinomycetota bacterium]